MQNNLRIAFIGDIVGRPGCAILKKWIAPIKKKYELDAVIVNGENSSARGKGITPKIFKMFKEIGVDAITTGNHAWFKKEIFSIFCERDDIARPANFPDVCPGKGYALFNVNGIEVAIINLQGRVFMHEHLNCPFRVADELIDYFKPKVDVIFVDFHAEATSEKKCLGMYLDGRVSGVFGTHMHVQTADDSILQNGTSYISDVGCCGAVNSVIGNKYEPILRKFLTQMLTRFEVEEEGPIQLSGIVVNVDLKTKKSTSIERIQLIDDQIVLTKDN